MSYEDEMMRRRAVGLGYMVRDQPISFHRDSVEPQRQMDIPRDRLDHPRITDDIIKRVKVRFFAGEFQGDQGADIVQMMHLVESLQENNRGDRMIEVLREQVAKLRGEKEAVASELKSVKDAFPPPECGDCSSEMSLENHGNQDFYVCGCHEGGCTCFQGHAPCSWCMHIIIADDWMLEHSSEHRAEKRAEQNQAKCIFEENERLTASRLCEEGPSAAAAAKGVRPKIAPTAAATPAKPKLIVRMQSGDWDGVENL